MAGDAYIPDQSYTFDGVNYRAGRPMPPDVAREHGLLDGDDDGGNEATPLPDDFPKGDLLRDAGFETIEGVDAAMDEALTEINGIGPNSLEEIRDTLDEIGE